MESGKRTVIKAVLWNVIGLIMMAIVGLAVTGSVVLGGTVALINTGIGLLSYVLYERLWTHITWGRN
jgi:uncharacterized membrane protein